MDRPPHNFAAASANAMAYTQQQRPAPNIQQQFGFHPQHQQFPTTVPAPFLPHPSQFPYHPHMQVPHQPQLHPQLLHLQQQQQPQPTFPSHLPPHLVSSPFHGLHDSPPLPVPPPSDPDLQKRIDKLVEYAAKNGPEFEAMIREKQQDNPDYNFLFGGEGNGYYRYKLWLSTRPQTGPYPSFPPSSVPTMHPPTNPAMNHSSLNAPPIGTAPPPPPQLHQTAFPPFYDQQHHYQHPQPFVALGRPDYGQSFKGLSGPLPSDVAMELTNMLSNLNGTKESIKSAKIWFMQRSPFAPALAEALRDRVFALDDSERQLHVIYLVNDILFDSLQRRANPRDLDNEALAFKPVLGSMLARIYHNPQNEENQSRLQRILQFWASKEVYNQDDIYALESEMISGPPTRSFTGPPKELPLDSVEASTPAGMLQEATLNNVSIWQPDKQGSIPNVLDQADKTGAPALIPPLANQQFLPNLVPTGAFPGSVPLNSNLQSSSQQQSSNIGEKLPPYPLFPPGLIPGMVRKMQIGSGVPYSPLSPLDIPTVIPPSNVSPSEVFERVSKFFKEIGEVNPSEGSLKSNSRDEDDEYEIEPPVRRGGACIPPPSNQQVDSDSGTYTAGSADQKPGPSGSGRLGLGATANPNEASQYDDVYTSYRKQRSTSYHSSMSARAGTR